MSEIVTIVFLALVVVLFSIRRRGIEGQRATLQSGAIALLGTFLLNVVGYLPIEETTATDALLASIVVVVLAWTRYASLATIVAVAAAPFLVVLGQRLGWIHDDSALLPAVIAGIAALIVIRHRSNLRRLWAGREPKLTERLKSPAS